MQAFKVSQASGHEAGGSEEGLAVFAVDGE